MDELELYHFGIKGQKWGVRRYQNKDGSLTPAGKKRQAVRDARDAMNYARADKRVKRIETRMANKTYKQSKKEYREAKRDYREQKEIDRFNKHGLDYNPDTASTVYNYGFKAAKRIETRMANKGMSRFKSETIESGRILAKSAALAIGTIAVADLVIAAANPKYQVMDSAGKVIRNVYR